MEEFLFLFNFYVLDERDFNVYVKLCWLIKLNVMFIFMFECIMLVF